MADVPERLFRDEAGAAFERVARLEQENQQLRAELRRFQRPDEAPTLRTRKPSEDKPQAAFAVLGAAVGIMLAFGAVVVALHPEPPPPSAAFASPRMTAPPGLIGASPITPATVATAEPDDCDTPFTYDEQGVKHYKQQCIHPERGAR